MAVILDDFSCLAFRYEWAQIEITPQNWYEELQARPVDLLFVESAWSGNDKAWLYHLTGPTAPRPALVELVQWCRAHGVPTVFWNKEDPVHFEDFLDTARLFDHVFTSCVDVAGRYREELGHDRVAPLSFAAQPMVHNPVRPAKGFQARDIAFAGMYFAHKYPERRAQMDLLLGAAQRVQGRMTHGLEIFSRQLGGDERYQFPAPFDKRVVGTLSYPQMLSAYRAYKVFLNVNSVVDSPSMCARRIFEITASGTPVVSAPSAAIEHFFTPDMVCQVGEAAEAEFALRALVRSPELRDRMVHLGQRRIWSMHTYAHRVDDVLTAAGVAGHRHERPSVSVLVSTHRPWRLDHVLQTVASQLEVSPQLLVLAHGFDLEDSALRARAKEAGIVDVMVLHAGKDVPLGSCLNMLVEAADGAVVSKMDDDDLYGDHYLSDQLHALDYSGAQVVGKQAHFLYAAEIDATILRYPEREHCYTDFVAGPTIMTNRDLLLKHPFPEVRRGEDSGFLRSTVAAGAQVYSSDRYNFVQMRYGSGHQHTWLASDAELLANAEVQFYGKGLAHCML
ncbi:glycosyltransferase family protein [Segeticoccus rhizosphaerae]|uniref:glycosyltransferase family protein n=1 Tax=Segeticoccus rhizosphaerae TaxID=1104777 RepID=UPI001EF0B41F|nr:glycosyltransferase [Segeticoccus rhizosphaerae]